MIAVVWLVGRYLPTVIQPVNKFMHVYGTHITSACLFVTGFLGSTDMLKIIVMSFEKVNRLVSRK